MQEQALLRKLFSRMQAIEKDHKSMLERMAELLKRPRTLQEEIDSIKGRRLWYALSGTLDFTIDNNGRRADPINMLISQDGPFIATHWPVVMWKVTQPTNADNFGRWRPVYSWPLPDQVLDTDIIELSVEYSDSGSQRLFQNESSAPIFSRPDALHPLPLPVLFAPNSIISTFLIFEQILFSTTGVASTGGQVKVTIPGYRIANL